MRLQILVVLLPFALGCPDKNTSDSGSTGSFDEDDSADTDDTDDPDEDPTDNLPAIDGSDEDPGGCEDFSGTAIPGAASMFYGEYRDEGTGTWTGEETWLIFANEAWKEVGGADCQVVWNVIAAETSTPACTGCDIGLSATLEIDNGQTTCDTDLVTGLGNTTTYGIARKSNGEASWYFGSSGEHMGDGYHVSEAMNFLTEPSCRWW